jgi:hypothetical protein
MQPEQAGCAIVVACCAQICLPDWPWWNRHPLPWIQVDSGEEEEAPAAPVKKSKDREKKKKANKAA